MPTKTGPEPLRDLTRGLPPDVPRSWLALLLVAQAALILLGSKFFGRSWPADIAMFYLILAFIPLMLDDSFKKELLRGTLREYAIKFTFGFLVTLLIFWGLMVEVLHFPRASIAYSTVWPMITLQAFFVAPVEELFFRGWLTRVVDPKGTTWRLYAGVSLGQIVAAATFSTFHFAAYGTESAAPYIITFSLAIVWTWASRLEAGFPFHTNGRRPLGIPFTIGSHLAWNLCAMGILTGGVLLNT